MKVCLDCGKPISKRASRCKQCSIRRIRETPEFAAKRLARLRQAAAEGRLGPQTPEGKELAAWNRGKQLSPSHRAAISKALKGKPKTAEHAKHISEARTGVRRSPEAREHIRAANQARRKQAIYTCKNCGKTWQAYQGLKHRAQGKGGSFCSVKCLTAFYSGPRHYNWKGGTTPEILARCGESRWKALADFIRARDDNHCRLCGRSYKKRKLPVHHIIPWIENGPDEPWNLISLCHRCHAKVDHDPSTWRDTLFSLIAN